MMQYGISPENIIEVEDYTPEMRKIISDGVTVEKILNRQLDLSFLKGKNITLTPNGQFFRTDRYGFLPEILDGKYIDRKMYKNKMIEKEKLLESGDYDNKEQIENEIKRYYNIQWAKKISLNSAYGATGSAYFRFYDTRMAEAVTMGSQLAVQWVAKYINEYMRSVMHDEDDYVIYSDTDSAYVNLQKVVDRYCRSKENEKIIDFMDAFCKKYIEKVIEISYDELAEYVNAPRNKMKMKREVLAIGGFWTAKKRYALNIYDDEGVRLSSPKLKITGLEVVKSSTPNIVKTKLKQAIDIIINKDERSLQEFVKEFKKEFMSMDVEDISIPSGVNDIEKYKNGDFYNKGTPIRQKASINYNNLLKKMNLDRKYSEIKEKDKIKYTYLKMPNPIKDEVIAFPNKMPKEFKLEKYVDYSTQFEKTFISPLTNITKHIGWEIEKRATLF